MKEKEHRKIKQQRFMIDKLQILCKYRQAKGGGIFEVLFKQGKKQQLQKEEQQQQEQRCEKKLKKKNKRQNKYIL